jgi:hypothetical protein
VRRLDLGEVLGERGLLLLEGVVAGLILVLGLAHLASDLVEAIRHRADLLGQVDTRGHCPERRLRYLFCGHVVSLGV